MHPGNAFANAAISKNSSTPTGEVYVFTTGNTYIGDQGDMFLHCVMPQSERSNRYCTKFSNMHVTKRNKALERPAPH